MFPLYDHGDPVKEDEGEKDDWDEDNADGLDLLGGPPTILSDQSGHDGELDQDQEDEEDAHDHPDVQETHIAYLKRKRREGSGKKYLLKSSVHSSLEQLMLRSRNL